MAMVYLSSEEGKSQKAFSICHNMQVTGMLLAAGVYSLWIKQQYRMAGLFTVISYGVVFLLSFGLKEVPHEKTKEQLPSGKQFTSLLVAAIKDRQFLMFLIGAALFNEAHQMVTTFLSQLEYERCGINAKYFGYILIIVTLSGLVSPLSVGFINRLGRKRGISVLTFMATGVCLMMVIIHQPVLSILGMMILRMASSLFEPLQNQIQNEKVTSSERATVLSMNAVFMESVGVMVNMVFGPIMDRSLSSAFLLSAILYLAGGMLINKIQR